MDPNQLTALILTRDEERNLPRALTSLPHGVKAFVLDAQSDDRTVEFAQSWGATVEVRPWTNFVEARQYALSRITTPWVLMLDADEALDDRLSEAIVRAGEDVNGYVVRRTTYFFGKPMRLWSNEPLVRLVKRDAASIEAMPAAGGSSQLHERIVCDEPVGELDGTLLHYSYSDWASYKERFDHYTSIEAQGVRGTPGKRFKETVLVPARLLNNLLRRGAILDGRRGVYIAWTSAMYPAIVAWKALPRQARDDT